MLRRLQPKRFAGLLALLFCVGTLALALGLAAPVETGTTPLAKIAAAPTGPLAQLLHGTHDTQTRVALRTPYGVTAHAVVVDVTLDESGGPVEHHSTARSANARIRAGRAPPVRS